MCRYVPDGAVRAKKVGHPPVFQPYSHFHEETRSLRHMPILWTASVRDWSFGLLSWVLLLSLSLSSLPRCAFILDLTLCCFGYLVCISQTRVKNGRNIKFLIIVTPHVYHNL